MRMSGKAAALIPAALVMACLSATAALGGENLGARLSKPMSISELTEMVTGWSKKEWPERRTELIDLVREGEAEQAQNAALLLRRLSPPFIGVKKLPPNGGAEFTEDAITIYNRMVATGRGPGLALVLDELLMSGSGMLFTFVGRQLYEVHVESSKTEDGRSRYPVYGSREIDAGERRIAILEGIVQEFPASRFTPFAAQSIGDVLLEMFLFSQQHDPAFLARAIAAYDAGFKGRIEKEAGGKTDLRLLDDLGVKLAIAMILNGDADGARVVLFEVAGKVERNAPKITHIDQFYVDYYLPFFSGRVSTIFNAYDFVQHLSAYVDSADRFDPSLFAGMTEKEFVAALSGFSGHLSAFQNRDYKIIFMSSRDREMIEAGIQDLQSQIDASDLDVTLERMGGDPWYGISTASAFTRSNALELRNQLIEAGLPADAYLWRPEPL